MGRFNVFRSLATLAFNYPPRAEFFRGELEQFLLLTRENGIPPMEGFGHSTPDSKGTNRTPSNLVSRKP